MKLNRNATAGKRGTHQPAKPHRRSLCAAAAIAISLWLAGAGAHAQVNSGSNGSDGAFNPTTNTVIDMADHPTGIYHYTSVNISNGVTVTFIPNANNTPVVWLVQSNVIISGQVNVSGVNGNANVGGAGGPGGYRGGNGGTNVSSGQGPGGGNIGFAGNASFATGNYATNGCDVIPIPSPYGNNYLVPLVGGSGGGGFPGISPSINGAAGGGGGGAILIAASGTIQLDGQISAYGGSGVAVPFFYAGGGSGGAVRLVASAISGSGTIRAQGYSNNGPCGLGGLGRVRFDSYANNFGGNIFGVLSQGSQFIISPMNGQGAQLTVTSVGGVPVSASPSGQLATPDALLSAQQNNPIPIVVHCSNIPLNTQITVSVKPASGAAVSATGLNSSGTLSSSTATVLLNMPRGGGIIYASAATGN